MKRRVLIACEYSATCRTAFEQCGWEAMSCDILPSEVPGLHYKGNVLDIINENWNLLIGFPPCTYLTYAGMGNWCDSGRVMKRIEAAYFFMQLYDAPINHVCIESPRGIMYKIFRQPDQEIHPYYFGDRNMKRTGLWLKNLPKLQYQLQPDLFSSNVTSTEKPAPLQIQTNKKSGKIKKTLHV